MKRHFTHPLLAASCIAAFSGVSAQRVGINATGTAAAPSAMLDLVSTNKGILIPRMTEAQRAGIPAPANGLIVYQTAPGAVPATSPKGYWYYDQLVPAWVPVVSGGLPWTLTGNAGTNPATDYVGTSDAQVFTLRTNGVERLRVQGNAGSGRVGIGTVAVPNEMLELNGGLLVNAAAATNTAGSIQWNGTDNFHEGNVTGAAAGWYPLENVFTERLAQTFQFMTGGCAAITTVAALAPKQIGSGAQTTAGTIESPYSNFWEDGRHQYLYLASELTAIGMCPNMNITGLAMDAINSSSMPVRNFEIKLKNTTTTTMTNFDYTGLTLVYTNAALATAVGWNMHTFAVPFQWNGSSNLIVETCHNNYDWDFNTVVRTAPTAGWNGLFGSYCDACGGTGAVPCVPTVPPNPGCVIGPCGPGCPGNCSGYSMIPGCMHAVGMNLVTCDGTFQWIGAQGGSNKHPQIRFAAFYGSLVTTNGVSDYLYSDLPVMIGTHPFFTLGGGPFPTPINFKGPGTISAEASVWSGNTLLSDFVFDQYFDGQVRPEDAHGAEFKHTPLREMVNYVERERHLPTIDGRAHWQEHGPASVNHLTNQLWMTVEEQALYIKELNERMDLLEQHLVQKRLNELKH